MSILATNTIQSLSGQKILGTSGGILQVVQVVKTDTFASTPGAQWVDVSGLSANITPSSSTNKILILADIKGAGTNASTVIRSRLLRDSTAIYIGDASSNRPRGMGQFYNGDGGDHAFYIAQLGGIYLDSPSTTSTITYKIQIGGDSNIITLHINKTSGDRDTTYYDSRVPSSITLMEIVA